MSAESERAVAQLYRVSREIMAMVPPIDPPPQYWLDSDATFSYCYPCARKARATELGLAEPPAERDWFERSEADEEFEDGIDGGAWYSGESDSTVACQTCGETLRYSLTDYGALSEIDHFLEFPVSQQRGIDGETTYALDRMFMHGDWDGADPDIARNLLTIARDAVPALSKARPTEGEGR